MGNQQMYGKRCAEADQYGNVFLDLEGDTYTAGDTVNGHVYVNIKQRYPGDKLCIKIKGKEETRWIDIINKSVQKPDGTFENHQEKIPREEERTIIKQEIVIYDWAYNNVLNPGQFSFPISFKVPNGLPGTFFYGAGELAAEVKYGICAFIQPENHSMAKIKHKREITLREPVQANIQTREVSLTKEVKTGCCCSSQGTVSVKTSFQKDAYAPSEVANIFTEVDNSKCSINIADIRFQLSHRIQLRSQQSHRSFNYVIASTSLGSIQSGQSFVREQGKLAGIQLPPAQIGRSKDFKGGNVNSYQYDHTKSITPSTNGVLVKSTYSLEVICMMDGCLCCDSNPANYLPIQIYSVVQRPVQKPQTPPNWQPTVMPPATITVNIVNNGGNGSQNIQINMGGNNNMANSNMPQQQISVNINNNQSQPQSQPQAQPQYNQTQPPQYQQQQQPQNNQLPPQYQQQQQQNNQLPPQYQQQQQNNQLPPQYQQQQQQNNQLPPQYQQQQQQQNNQLPPQYQQQQQNNQLPPQYQQQQQNNQLPPQYQQQQQQNNQLPPQYR